MATKHIIRKPSLSLLGVPHDIAVVVKPLKEAIELITGAAGNRQITRLKSSATDAQVIAKINEIIAQINSSGEAKDGY